MSVNKRKNDKRNKVDQSKKTNKETKVLKDPTKLIALIFYFSLFLFCL